MNNDDLLSNESEKGDNPATTAQAASTGTGLATAGTALTKLQSDDAFEEPGEIHHAIKPGEILMLAQQKLRLVAILLGWFYSGLIFLTVFLAICLLAPNVIYAIDHNTPWLMHFARLLVSLVAVVLALGCVAICVFHQHINAALEDKEYEIDAVRDMTLIQMQATRYNLEELTEKLSFPEHKEAPSPLDYINVAKKIPAFLALITSPERNLVTIGVEGLKFFQAVKKILNR